MYVKCCASGERMKQLAQLVQDLQKMLPPGCNKSEIVVYYYDDILRETDFSEAELVTYIKCCDHGKRISQIALHVNELMRSSAQNISLSEFVADNLNSILEGTDFTEGELIRYSRSCGIKSCDESFLERYDLVKVEREGKDSIQVKCTKCGVARWTCFTLKNGSSLTACKRISMLMGLHWKRTIRSGDTNRVVYIGGSVVLRGGSGHKGKHALNEMNNFFGENGYYVSTDGIQKNT